MKELKTHRILQALVLLFALAMIPTAAIADESSKGFSQQDTIYYLGNVVNTGLDNGYSDVITIEGKDPHFGWELGRFYVSGFTGKKDGETPIFLKNSGDQVALYFTLDQNISALNGNEALVISEDRNGYDERYGVQKTNFGRGALIVRHTDYQNAQTEPQIYVDYLSAIEVGANTRVDLFEEGDYEVTLDYEIKSPGLLNNPIIHSYNNYRIFFKFKVRNSNTMAFLMDSETGNELFNGSITPNGFRIDLAGSHYLNVSIKRELMNDTGDGLVEDTRFNRIAADKDVFTDEGIYTITISNPSTGEEPTIKKVYVGDDDTLKASVANSMTVSEVQNQIEHGARVAEDGTLMPASMDVASPEYDDAAGDTETTPESAADENVKDGLPVVPLAIALVAAITVVSLFLRLRRTRSSIAAANVNDENQINPEEDSERTNDDGAAQ